MRIALIWQGSIYRRGAAPHGARDGRDVRPGARCHCGLPPGPPFALLASPGMIRGRPTGKDAGYQFRGYHLDDALRPAFSYDFGGVHVTDYPVAVTGKDDPGFRRTLTFQAAAPPGNLFMRAAVGDDIKPACGRRLPGGWAAGPQGVFVRILRGGGADSGCTGAASCEFPRTDGTAGADPLLGEQSAPSRRITHGNETHVLGLVAAGLCAFCLRLAAFACGRRAPRRSDPQESDYYRMLTLATPPGTSLEAGDLVFMGPDKLAASDRYGDIYIGDGVLGDPGKVKWSCMQAACTRCWGWRTRMAGSMRRSGRSLPASGQQGDRDGRIPSRR
jgi:hypothetical protein